MTVDVDLTADQSSNKTSTTVVAVSGRRAKPDFPVRLTDEAVRKVASLVAQEGPSKDGPLPLRVAVRPGGCSGFSYELIFDSAQPDDLTRVMSEPEGRAVTVVVDPDSARLITGSTIDYQDGLSAGFSIVNPNATRTCGCGSSFS